MATRAAPGTWARAAVATRDVGPVRHVRLARPDTGNALDAELVAELHRAFAAAGDDPAVHAVVVSGDGSGFSSGTCVAQLAALSAAPSAAPAFAAAMTAAWSVLERMPKPTVALLHGSCFGSALELALCCDLRVMADDAVLALPEARVGCLPHGGGVSRLPALIGLGRAKDLVLTGRHVSADEALRIGLVSRTAPADELAAATDDVLTDILSAAPLAVAHAKRLLDAAARPGLATALEHEAVVHQVCAQSIDFLEGTHALAQDRPPAFSGC